jgi:hypothetical protein
MAPKNRAQLSINAKPAVTGFGGLPTNSTADVAQPANPILGAPYDLTLTTATGYSSAAPTAVIDATWLRPLQSNPANYTIQVSTSVTFTASGTITAQTFPGVESAHIEGLLPGTLYYVRVRANAPGVVSAWSSMSPLVTGENRITTATDTTAAGVPTSPAAVWIGTGDLRITWVNPTEANFKTVHIRVRASSGGAILREWDSRAGVQVYTFAQNYADTTGAPDSSLYVELWSITFSNVASATVNTGLITKTAPATPASVAQSWAGDTGAARDDWTINWAPASDAAQYRLVIDGVNHFIAGAASHYTYTLAANDAEHAGTPDPVLTYALTALDAFGLVSTAVSGTATNAAPSTPGTLTSSWAGDTGAAGPDCTISWVASTGATQGYRLTIDGIAHDQIATRRIYTLDNNRADHAGTPDPVLTISVLARDGFQSSSSAVGTATNAAPAAPVATLEQGAVAGVTATVTSTPPADFWRYEFVFKRDGSTVATIYSTGATAAYEAQAAADVGYHSWTVVVRQQDLFAQFSATHTPAAVAFEGLTLTGLRAGARYSDSTGATDATLKAALADGNTTSSGISYSA